MEMDVSEISSFLDLGIAGLILAAIILGWRRYWVFGWKYEEVVRERDAWREIALRSLGVAEQLLSRLSRED
jgi:hypothetical protein